MVALLNVVLALAEWITTADGPKNFDPEYENASQEERVKESKSKARGQREKERGAIATE